MSHHETDSEFLHHEPCPSCGSSDAGARYSDGHLFCHKCEHHEKGETDASNGTASISGVAGSARRNMSAGLIHGGEIKALTKRGITAETCQKFNYRVGASSRGAVQIAEYRDQEGNVCAQHCRTPSKDFFWLGESKNVQLFGQHLWGGGKMIVVTEGEIDAMSVSQLQNNKWPVVSLPSGASSGAKAIKANLKFFDQFETVILMFDMDDAGREAAAECAPLFAAGKCKVAHLPLKDANECLQAGKGGDVISAIWNAKPWRPDGVVKLGDLKDAMRAPVETGLPWCFESLTRLTYGRRFGEVYALGAGTGVGKTDVLTQQIAYDVTELGEKVGLFFLEQQPVESGKRIAGKIASKRFHVPDAGWIQEELDATIDELLKNDRLYFYDHFGCTDWSEIAATIRFLAVTEGVRIFYLDHLTALAASQDDERKALEVIMGEIGSLVKELNIIITLVSHLATPDGTPHEEGGRVMIRHFKGSRAIGFWCHFMFGLERDQQAEDLQERQRTTFRVLKDRYTGQATGQVFHLGYDAETGRLFETTIEGANAGSEGESF